MASCNNAQNCFLVLKEFMKAHEHQNATDEKGKGGEAAGSSKVEGESGGVQDTTKRIVKRAVGLEAFELEENHPEEAKTEDKDNDDDDSHCIKETNTKKTVIHSSPIGISIAF